MRIGLRYLARMLLLTIGIALVTYGAIDWQYRDFAMRGIWLYDNGWQPHPIHVLVAGIAIVPLAMWDIFSLEAMHHLRVTDAKAASDVPPSAAASDAPSANAGEQS